MVTNTRAERTPRRRTSIVGAALQHAAVVGMVVVMVMIAGFGDGGGNRIGSSTISRGDNSNVDGTDNYVYNGIGEGNGSGIDIGYQ